MNEADVWRELPTWPPPGTEERVFYLRTANGEGIHAGLLLTGNWCHTHHFTNGGLTRRDF